MKHKSCSFGHFHNVAPSPGRAGAKTWVIADTAPSTPSLPPLSLHSSPLMLRLHYLPPLLDVAEMLGVVIAPALRKPGLLNAFPCRAWCDCIFAYLIHLTRRPALGLSQAAAVCAVVPKFAFPIPYYFSWGRSQSRGDLRDRGFQR